MLRGYMQVACLAKQHNLDSYLYGAHTQQTDQSLPAHIFLL